MIKHDETFERLLGVMETSGVKIQGSVSGISNLSPMATQGMELYLKVKKNHETLVANECNSINEKNECDSK